MNRTLAAVLWVAVTAGSFLLLVVAGGCGQRVPTDPRLAVSDIDPDRDAREQLSRIRTALNRGAHFLNVQQSRDGAWRSDTYGTFKDGTALTPLALQAVILAAPDEHQRKGASAWTAAVFLAAMVKPDGSIEPPPHGFDYALYTSALSTRVLSEKAFEGFRPARDAW